MLQVTSRGSRFSIFSTLSARGKGYLLGASTSRMNVAAWISELSREGVCITDKAKEQFSPFVEKENADTAIRTALISQHRMKEFGFKQPCTLGELSITQLHVEEVLPLCDVLNLGVLDRLGCNKILIPTTRLIQVGSFLIHGLDGQQTLDFVPHGEMVRGAILAFQCK